MQRIDAAVGMIGELVKQSFAELRSQAELGIEDKNKNRRADTRRSPGPIGPPKLALDPIR